MTDFSKSAAAVESGVMCGAASCGPVLPRRDWNEAEANALALLPGSCREGVNNARASPKLHSLSCNGHSRPQTGVLRESGRNSGRHRSNDPWRCNSLQSNCYPVVASHGRPTSLARRLAHACVIQLYCRVRNNPRSLVRCRSGCVASVFSGGNSLRKHVPLCALVHARGPTLTETPVRS